MVNDPTKTLTLRRQAVSSINAKFNLLSRKVKERINQKKGLILTNAVETAEQLDEFSVWLEALIASIILIRQGRWFTDPIKIAYARGANQSRRAFKKNKVRAEATETLGLLTGFNTTSKSPIFDHSRHKIVFDILAKKDFTSLEAVTKTMSSEINRVLSQGILRGESIEEIASAVTDRINKIGKTRARLISRSEIAHAYKLATVEEGEILKQLFVSKEVLYLWITAIDGRERDSHRLQNGKKYKKANLPPLDEPNCRCSIAPELVNKKNKKR